MITQPTLCAIRFGAGLSPDFAPPEDGAALMASIAAEAASTDFPVTPWPTRHLRARARRDARRGLRPRDGSDPDPEARQDLRAINRADRDDSFTDLVAMLARLAYAPVGFHARLMRFWSNHFAAEARGSRLRFVRATYGDAALRPHLMGDFKDLLRAAVLHPVMLTYLDQTRSIGPLSRAGRRNDRGLNENLAREMLELHTLGASGSYTQEDVSQLARLLTGVTYSVTHGFRFRSSIAEPGIIEIFGKRYGGRPVRLDHIHEVLDDLALHPDTAAHLARSLARHFIADSPDPQLLAHMTARYLDTGGHLPALYKAMLEHPGAWQPPLAKTRAPLEMMAASLRALALPPQQLTGLRSGEIRRLLIGPLRAMGEPHQRIPSPAGYGEDAAYWITPQGLAARIDWAMGLAQLAPGDRDPREFVDIALADAASDPLRRAAAGAETRAQGIGMILAAPDFNRR